jgi:Contractile injection system tube protein
MRAAGDGITSSTNRTLKIMDAGEAVYQQFAGPLSELAHSICKLIIVQVERNTVANGNPIGGSGVGDSIASATLGAVGLGSLPGIVNNLAMGGKKFEVQINPEKYERSHKVKYRTPDTTGTPPPNPAFERMEGENLKINFTLDGTGVVPASVSNLAAYGTQMLTKTLGVTDVSYVTRRIQELKEVVYDFEDTTHEPPRVKVIWGDDTPFIGRMETLKVTYTLFHPSGIPLRADIELTFKQIESQQRRLQSPDVTHRREVTDHDRLPLLAEGVYGNATYAWQVAQANNLTHYRRLKTGSEIHLPALERRFLKP